MPPRTSYTKDTLRVAVYAVLAQEHTIASASRAHDIPLRTLREHVTNARNGNSQPVSMGPPPVSPRPFELDLVAWILAMERDGHPVGCREITNKATEMVAVVQDMHPQN
ncbi:hypothetical protein AaE_014908 [Aphanomyces astaci]|uniref:HTH psq-type domain-containing protein n=1 Tax=Aphanomyces astaci TaxID=112090 RepID=A0A6A4Z5E6_APHAT|nr:hypothetical protein AaE_014908 [Aphanomyces astaci]